MGKKWKGYLVFTSYFYRIIMFGLMPVALTALGIWGGIYIGDIGLVLAVVLLPMVEIFSDSWLFGGIQGKDMEKMDYLKTSSRGMAVVRGALVIDLVRKFINALAIIFICYIILLLSKGTAGEKAGAEMLDFTDFIGYAGIGQEIAFGLYLVLLAYFLSALGTFLSRYGNSIYINMLIGYGAAVLMVLGLFGLGLRGYLWGGILLLDVLLALLGIGVSIVAVRLAMKKVEGGYYDE